MMWRFGPLNHTTRWLTWTGTVGVLLSAALIPSWLRIVPTAICLFLVGLGLFRLGYESALLDNDEVRKRLREAGLQTNGY